MGEGILELTELTSCYEPLLNDDGALLLARVVRWKGILALRFVDDSVFTISTVLDGIDAN